MRGETRRKIEMAARVREFSRANPSTEQPHEDTVARLEQRIARADALAQSVVTHTARKSPEPPAGPTPSDGSSKAA